MYEFFTFIYIHECIIHVFCPRGAPLLVIHIGFTFWIIVAQDSTGSNVHVTGAVFQLTRFQIECFVFELKECLVLDDR